MNISAIIMAAGRGSRLAPLTDTIPKPLVEVNTTPLLQYTLLALAPLVTGQTIIVTNWLEEKIQAYLRQRPQPTITTTHQNNPKGGTLDSMACGYRQLQPCDGIIVSNSDDIIGPEMYAALNKHIQNNSHQAAICALTLDDQSQLKNYGVITTENSYFKAIVEKPTKFVSNLVNIGLYYFPYEAVTAYLPKAENSGDTEWYLTEHFLNPYSQNHTISVISAKTYWLPVGNHAQLQAANEFFAQNK